MTCRGRRENGSEQPGGQRWCRDPVLSPGSWGESREIELWSSGVQRVLGFEGGSRFYGGVQGFMGGFRGCGALLYD